MAPRVFIIRHGETTWSLNGRHTGRTDLPLTEEGEKRIVETGKSLVGEDKMIRPSKIACMYCSPRLRAQQTLERFNTGFTPPWQPGAPAEPDAGTPPIIVRDELQEWDYGDYEGRTSADINAARKQAGLPVPWNLWHEGCPGGEKPGDVAARVDTIIAEIRARWHGPALHDAERSGDVLVFAHAHLLRAFTIRWLGMELQNGPTMLIQPGGVGNLTYEHGSIHEPAICLGSSFHVPVAK